MDVKPPIHFDRDIMRMWKDHYTRRDIKYGRGMKGFFKGDPFQRYRGQDGEGFFGDIFKQWGLPIISYLGRKGASTALEFGNDLLSGENVKKSFKKRGKELAKSIASDVADRATRFAQTGEGKKKRRRKISSRTRKINRRKANRKVKPNRKSKRRQIKFF